MKIGILFNCQHEGLRLSMQALRPDDMVVSFGFPALSHSAALRDQALADMAQCDVVIAQPGSGLFKRDEMLKLRGKSANFLMLPAVAFAGFHPDVVYFTSGSGRRQGPTEALNSRIAMAAYLGGLDCTETAALYNRLVFARLGYFGAFGHHAALLTERFSTHGFDIKPLFDTWLATGCFMYSPLHPKGFVLTDIARLACREMGLSVSTDHLNEPDTLAHLARHPVHGAIADEIGVEGETDFRPATRRAGSAVHMAMADYLAASFDFYSTVPRTEILAANGVTGALQALDLCPV